MRRRGGIYREVRGAGLMRGLLCGPDIGAISARLTDEGLLTVGAAENVLRLLPPLIVEESHVDEAVAIFDRVAEDWDDTA